MVGHGQPQKPSHYYDIDSTEYAAQSDAPLGPSLCLSNGFQSSGVFFRFSSRHQHCLVSHTESSELQVPGDRGIYLILFYYSKNDHNKWWGEKGQAALGLSRS